MRIVAWAATLFLVYLIVHVPISTFREWCAFTFCIGVASLMHYIADENLLEEIKKAK